MYPREHALFSGAVVAAASTLAEIPTPEAFLWIGVGILTGVFIDVDHLFLAALIGGKREEALKWFRNPVGAVLKPRELMDDIRYSGRWIYVHRMVSHISVLVILILLMPFHDLFIPAAVGLAAHIAADVVWDLYHGNYVKEASRGMEVMESGG